MTTKQKLAVAALLIIPGAIPATAIYLGFQYLKKKVKNKLQKDKKQ
jgi:hypothetical protein